MFRNFLTDYGLEMLVTILSAVFGYIGLQLKRLYEDKVNTETKRKTAETVVKAVEQIYANLHGDEKYFKAEEALAAMLNEKGIMITDLECEMLIEAAVLGLKQGWQKEGKTDEI